MATAIVGAFGLLFVGILAGVAVFMWMRLKKFAAVELTPIADVEPPFGKIRGKVVLAEEDEELLRAPFSSVECAGYYLQIERYELRVTTERRGNRNVTVTRREWVPVFGFVDGCEFQLKDKSGVADIDLEGAKALDIMDGERREGGSLSYQGKVWRRIAASCGPTFSRLGDGQYRAKEQLVLVGDKLLVFGNVRVKEGSTPAFAAVGKKGNKQDLLVTDRTDEQMQKRLELFAWGFTIAAGVMAVIFIGIAGLINLVGK